MVPVLWSSLARSVHCLLPPIWPGHPGARATGKEATYSTASPWNHSATAGKGSEVSTPHPHSPMDLCDIYSREEGGHTDDLQELLQAHMAVMNAMVKSKICWAPRLGRNSSSSVWICLCHKLVRGTTRHLKVLLVNMHQWLMRVAN